ncbi:MAG: hypothetical protein AAGC44_05775 [Planctomycetota bacterium]
MKRWLRRLAFVLPGGFVLLVCIGCIFGPDFIAQKRAGKYEPAAATAEARPTPVASAPVAEKQTEPHTCGLHAARSLYAAYGLDPDRFDLRFRLGTDAKALRFDQTSTGTLHPDLYRVLHQDGFTTQRLDLESPDAASCLEEHLDREQLALALVYRGTYHWVLLAGHEEAGRALVMDSLLDEPSPQPIALLLTDDALSVTLVQPSDRQEGPNNRHRDGIGEMLDASRRK